MKSAFQKLSAVTAVAIALALVPLTAGTASAEEPGWQSPVAGIGETVTDVLGEPGWQDAPSEPGWQDVPNEPGWQSLPADSTE